MALSVNNVKGYGLGERKEVGFACRGVAVR